MQPLLAPHEELFIYETLEKYMKLANILLGCSMLIGTQGALLAKTCPVDLSYQEIYDDFWETETEVIQHQFAWQEATGMKEIELQEDFKIPLKPIFAGTEADPRSKVYGYNDDGSLDLEGGAKKSYNPDFTKFRLRYHGALDVKYPFGDAENPIYNQPLGTLFPNIVQSLFQFNIPYFVERGFDIQGSDTFKKFSDQYMWTSSAGQTLPFIAMRVIWDDKDSDKKIPAYIDLHASINNNPGEYFVLDTYKDCPSKHKNGYGYPTRIPVTTNFCQYKKCLNTSPIAFYDKKCNVVTVHVPTTDCDSYFLTKRYIDIGNPIINKDFTEHLAGFDGSFKLFSRDKCGKLSPSSFANMDLFAQVSDVVTIRSRVLSNGELSFFEAENLIRDVIFDDSSVYYTGVVASPINGGSKAYDLYAVPFPDLNAYQYPLDPIDIPGEKGHNGHHCAHGDNPVTKVKERYSSVSATTLWDNDIWNFDALRLPLAVLKGEVSYPENASTTAIPTPVGAADSLIFVNAHEFTHQAQFASGVIQFLPAEGMAVGVELDPHASAEAFAPFRAGAFTNRLIRTLRGEFTPMRSEPFGLTTYGLGLWWKYLQDQFDHNNQVMRRTMDVLSSETLGPLLEQKNIPDQGATFPVNQVGANAALNQALGELFGKNIKDVWNDYCISVTLLRNNTSIPPQWRNYFPYWVYNTDYSGYDKILDATNILGLGQFANWWEQLQNNTVIPASFNLPAYTGQTFIRTLPVLFEVSARSLSTYAFNVTKPSQGGPASIKVTVPTGEWRVTLVQFTSDGTKDGSFIADGPHTVSASGTNTITFDMAAHSPAFTESGNIRLICVNTNFNGTGTQLSEYFTAEAPNSSIKIEAPLP